MCLQNLQNCSCCRKAFQTLSCQTHSSTVICIRGFPQKREIAIFITYFPTICKLDSKNKSWSKKLLFYNPLFLQGFKDLTATLRLNMFSWSVVVLFHSLSKVICDLRRLMTSKLRLSLKYYQYHVSKLNFLKCECLKTEVSVIVEVNFSSMIVF